MRPSKCIQVITRRKEYIDDVIEHFEDRDSPAFHRYNAESIALTWALSLMQSELEFRASKIADGTWVAADEGYMKALSEFRARPWMQPPVHAKHAPQLN